MQKTLVPEEYSAPSEGVLSDDGALIPGEAIEAFGIDHNIPVDALCAAHRSAEKSFDRGLGARNMFPTEDGMSRGWKTYNFEVAEHHTYIADGIRVHNRSATYTLDDNGRIEKLTGTDGQEIEVNGSWTPTQVYHYGRVEEKENPDGTKSLVLTSGGVLESFSATARSLADALGFDGRIGIQGTFSNVNEGYQPKEGFHEEGKPQKHFVDWSGDKDHDKTPDWRDETYSNIGHWGGDRDGDGVPNWRDRNDGVGWRDKNEGGEDDTEGDGKPIILDMDGDGIEIQANSNVSFDMDADGFLEQTAWASPDDAFLVIDLNADGTRGAGDGKINQTQELAFTEWVGTGGVTDLQAMAIFDVLPGMGGNNDGFLSAADTVWNELRVWQDANSNGITDPGELKTLSQLGITRINLSYDDGTAYDDNRNDVEIFGSKLLGTASYTRNGTVVEGGVGDVSLRFNGQGWRHVETGDGYNIEFEHGAAERFATIKAGDPASLNLATDWLAGATGDDRNNTLNAMGVTRPVNMSGGAGADTLMGGLSDDFLSGGEGVDELIGAGGNDQIFFDAQDNRVSGGIGYDTAIYTGSSGVRFDLQLTQFEVAYGGDGRDTLLAHNSQNSVVIDGRGGNDYISGGSAADVLSGGDGIDTINAGGGDDKIQGGSGDDVLNAQAGDDAVFGGADNDTLNGGAGDDQLFGGSGADSLAGGDGDDLLSGNSGADTLKGAAGDDRLSGGADADVLDGGDGDDLLRGGAGNDVFRDGAGDDQTEGAAGDDVFYDGVGDDRHIGGAGNDTFHVSGYSGSNIVQGGAGTDTLILDGSASAWNWKFVQDGEKGIGQYLFWSGEAYVHVQDVERVTFTGANHRLFWSHQDRASSAEFSLALIASQAHLSSTLGTDWQAGEKWWLAHGKGDQSLVTFNALKYLAANHDVYDVYGLDIVKATEHYIAYGQSEGRNPNGFDAVQYLRNYADVRASVGTNLSAATIHYIQHGRAAGRTDSVIGSSLSDSAWASFLASGAGASSTITLPNVDVTKDNRDSLYLANNIAATDLNATIYGKDTLAKTISGGSGNDKIYADRLPESRSQQPTSTIQNDTVYAGAGSDSVWGGMGADILHGNGGADALIGGSGHDSLFGGTGADSLLGQDGNDFLSGQEGSDVISAGSGNDVADGGNGADTIFGGSGDDKLIGNVGADYLSGGDGADTLIGGEGSDVLRGNANDDQLVGDDGSDYLEGGDGNDTLDGGLQGDNLKGGKGNDTALGGAGNDHIEGGDGDDSLIGGAGFDILEGGGGQDQIFGGDDDDVLKGNAGNDTLNGGVGRDTLIGGAGADVLNGSSGLSDMVSYEGSIAGVQVNLEVVVGSTTVQLAIGGDAAGDQLIDIENVTGSAHDDVLTGSSISNVILGAKGNDIISGMDGNDHLRGGGGDDTLSGGLGHDFVQGDDGDDLIQGSWGNDTIQGGGGYDTIDFSNAGVMVDINLQSNHNRGNAQGQTFFKIEGVKGTQFNDLISGNAANNTIDGNAGNDSIDGWIGNDVLHGGIGWDTLQGSQGNDQLFGGAGNDALLGGAGNDTLLGGTGQDVLKGGAGIDLAHYGDATSGVQINLLAGTTSGGAAGDQLISIEHLHGSEHADDLRGDGLDNMLRGSGGNDNLLGGDGDDILYGDDGKDQLFGGDGADTLNGGNGDDVLRGMGGGDELNGGAGFDMAHYGDATQGIYVDLLTGETKGGAAGDRLTSIEHLYGSDFNDHLRGDNGVNYLSGEGGNDTLVGRGLQDTLHGGAGNDQLIGGGGNDNLFGGAGADAFLFNSDNAGEGIDRIIDFEVGADHIVISGNQANSVADLTIEQQGSHTVIHSGPWHIVIHDITPDQLPDSAFVFL